MTTHLAGLPGDGEPADCRLPVYQLMRGFNGDFGSDIERILDPAISVHICCINNHEQQGIQKIQEYFQCPVLKKMKDPHFFSYHLYL